MFLRQVQLTIVAVVGAFALWAFRNDRPAVAEVEARHKANATAVKMGETN